MSTDLSSPLMKRTLSFFPRGPWYWAIFINPRGGYLFLYPGSINRMFLLAIPQSLEKSLPAQTRIVDPLLAAQVCVRLLLPAYGQLRLDETSRHEPLFPCLQQPQIYQFEQRLITRHSVAHTRLKPEIRHEVNHPASARAGVDDCRTASNIEVLGLAGVSEEVVHVQRLSSTVRHVGVGVPQNNLIDCGMQIRV